MTHLRSLKQRYLTYLGTQWGGSAKMVENYDRYLERFITFAKVTQPREITAERVASFRLYLSKQPGTNTGGSTTTMKQSTQNYYLIALRMFLKYLANEGFETITPQQVVLAKIPKQTPDVISPAELDRLRAAPDQKTIEGKRDRAIIELLCSAGLRISELCALSLTDIDLSANEFSAPNARGVYRTVFLSDTARGAVATYLQAREDNDAALFIRYGRKVANGDDLRIYPRAVQRMIKTHAAAAGINSLVTPHILRHTFADSLLQSGADLKSVQILLGHSSLDATRSYLLDSGSR